MKRNVFLLVLISLSIVTARAARAEEAFAIGGAFGLGVAIHEDEGVYGSEGGFISESAGLTLTLQFDLLYVSVEMVGGEISGFGGGVYAEMTLDEGFGRASVGAEFMYNEFLVDLGWVWQNPSKGDDDDQKAHHHGLLVRAGYELFGFVFPYVMWSHFFVPTEPGDLGLMDPNVVEIGVFVKGALPI